MTLLFNEIQLNSANSYGFHNNLKDYARIYSYKLFHLTKNEQNNFIEQYLK